MNENRFYHPALADVYSALDLIEAAQAQVKDAKQLLQATISALPENIGDNEDLRDEIFHHLYWFQEDINATSLKEAFRYKHASNGKKTDLHRLMRNAYLEITCGECGQPFQKEVTSRSELQRWRGYTKESNGGWATTCDVCKAKRDEVSHQRYVHQREQEAERLAELRTMRYYDYLQTPEWQARRKRAMKRAGFRCQVCNAYGVRLNVHHRTYERRGNEDDRDLITLCEDCHTTFHKNGRLVGDAS